MDPMQILIGILVRNERVKKAIDKGINDFLDGFSKPDARKPTREQQLQILGDMLQQMNKAQFALTFESRGEYLNFVLALITQTSALKSTDVVVRDFYSPGYYAYFPKPRNQPSPVIGVLARAQPVYAAEVDENPYHFYLVSAKARSQEILDALGKLVNDAADSVDASTLHEKLKDLGVAQNDVLTVQGIGLSGITNGWVFVSADDPSGTSDIRVESANPEMTRERIIEDLEALLNRESF